MRLVVPVSSFALLTTLALTILCVVASRVPSQEIERGSSRELDIELVEAEIALAKANLDFALDENKKRVGSYSAPFIAELRLVIDVHEAWLEQLKTDDPQFISIDIQKARGELEIAQLQLNATRKLREKIPGSISDSRMRTRELAVKSAQAWLKKVSDPSFRDHSRFERIQWRMVVLGKDILQLRMEAQR